MYSNNVILFLGSPSEFYPCEQILKEFLAIRGLIIKNDLIKVSSTIESFDFLSWSILRKSRFFNRISINEESIKKYKRKLKSIIRSSFNKNIISVIKSLNYEIQNWIKLHIFSDNWKNLSTLLDMYLYKLLWRYVRRCHPRRTNTWIYSKYWKRFSGIWKFFAVDLVQNRIVLLKSHTLILNYTYKVPNSLNYFNLHNLRKSFSSLSRKCSPSLSFGFNVLYKKQKGLCFICKNPLWLKDCKLIKTNVNHKGNDLLKNLSIVHSHCRCRY